jgi:MinD superfamily P-loop ATPase
MPYKIAIASGKGGTGKTTVSVNLYYYLSKLYEDKVQLLDCDVEEPNDALLINNLTLEAEKEVNQVIPKIDIEKCTFCRCCVEFCEFNAIVVIPPIKFAEINPDLCHSCGACLHACQDRAINEIPYKIGNIAKYNTPFGAGLWEGNLRIGSPMQTLMIKELKKETLLNIEIVLYDSPPGTSCPVVEAVSDTNYVVLVTEPTPFGLHDLIITVDLLKDMQKPFGVVVNKAGLGNDDVYQFLDQENIECLGTIPYMKEYAAKYAKGELIDDVPEEIERQYRRIIEKLERKFIQYEGNNYFKW